MIRHFRNPDFWLPCVFFAGLYVFLITVMHYHFYFIEKQSFFVFTSEFFQQHITKPGEILTCCSEFLVQFYTFPYIGAGVVAGLLFLVFILTKTIVRNLFSCSQHSTFFALVPSALLVFLFCSPFYKLTEVLAVICVLVGFLVHINLKNNRVRQVLSFGIFAILYVIAGAFGFVFVALCLAYELVFVKTEKTKKHAVVYAGLLSLFALFLPCFCRMFCWVMSYEQAYLNLFFHSNFDRKYPEFFMTSADVVRVVIIGCLVLLPWMVFVLKKFDFSLKNHVRYLLYGGFFLLFCWSLNKFGFSALQNKYEKVRYFVEQEDWERVWAICKPYFLNPDSKTTGYYSVALCEYTKLAAIMSKRLGEDYTELISYPGFNVLFPPNTALFGLFTGNAFCSDFYYSLGFYVLSRQDAQSMIGFKRPQNYSIRRIVRCNAILNDTMDNIRHINLLSRTLFQKQLYKNLKNDTIYLDYKRRLKSEKEIPEPLGGPDITVLSFAEFMPQNPYTLEYATMAYLLYARDETYLFEHLYRFRNLNYAYLPRFFEEALIASSGFGFDPNMTIEKLATMDFDGFRIRSETLARAEAFWAYLQRINQGSGNMKTLERNFRDSYFFHKFIR